MHKNVVHNKWFRHDVYIGRGTKFGNPFVLGKDGDRITVINKYVSWLKQETELIFAIKEELKDQILGCWCAPQECHGDVLARIADGENIENIIIKKEKV